MTAKNLKPANLAAELAIQSLSFENDLLTQITELTGALARRQEMTRVLMASATWEDPEPESEPESEPGSEPEESI